MYDAGEYVDPAGLFSISMPTGCRTIARQTGGVAAVAA